MNDLHWMTLVEAAGAIAARKLSPVELMSALLKRIGRLDPKLNVFIRLDREAAMEEARAAEAEIVSGRVRGPLHGVPVGIKDIIDVAGLPTTCHSKILIDNVAAADAVCVSRLRGAGAIVLGKLSTHEFAIGGPASISHSRRHATRGIRSSSRRLVLGIRGWRCCRPVPDGAGQRHRRQRAQPGQRLRHRRAQADLRPDFASWRFPALLHTRPCRTADAHRCR
jgi:hypothetical protein